MDPVHVALQIVAAAHQPNASQKDIDALGQLFEQVVDRGLQQTKTYYFHAHAMVDYLLHLFTVRELHHAVDIELFTAYETFKSSKSILSKDPQQENENGACTGQTEGAA